MLLTDKITAIYCLVDDLLKACNHHTPDGCWCSDAEIITTALVSALLFKGNQSLTIDYMHTTIQHRLCRSKAASPGACTALQRYSLVCSSRDGCYYQRAQ